MAGDLASRTSHLSTLNPVCSIRIHRPAPRLRAAVRPPTSHISPEVQKAAIENLVVADRCNGAKSDHHAATEHLIRWRARLEPRAADLAAVADRYR